MRTLISLCFLIGMLPGLQGQELSAAVDRNRILIGEPFHLQLTGHFAPGKATWINMDSLPHFEILEKQKADTIINAGQVTISQVWKLTSWDSGRWQIKPLIAGRFATKLITIDVAFSPSPFDTSMPYHEIKGIIAVKKASSSKWYWYLILAVVILALFLLFFPGEKKKTVAAGFVPDEGAYRTAMKKLDALEAQATGDSRQYHTELVHIFREYLQRRKNIRSHSRTTDDLAIQAKQLSLSQENFQHMLQALRLSDLVKFAKFQPSASENKNALQTIRESITSIEETPHAV